MTPTVIAEAADKRTGLLENIGQDGFFNPNRALGSIAKC